MAIVLLKEMAVSILDESKFVIVKYDSLFATPFLHSNSFPRGVLPRSKKEYPLKGKFFSEGAGKM